MLSGKGGSLTDTALTEEELAAMLDRIMREVTEQTVGVRLHSGEKKLGENLCTVHISFNKGFHSSLSLCAEMALMERLARKMFGEDIREMQDIEDFAKEYLNILCGRLVRFLYRATHIGASFGVPVFYRGRYAPADQKTQFVLTYMDEQQEGAQLSHLISCARKPGTGVT